MRDYPKVNAQAINSHDVSREFFFQGIKNALADTSKIIYDKKDRKAGLFSTKTHDFLFYQRGFRASVYYQKKSEWNPTPFADITKYIAKDAGEIYSGDFIIDICMATDKENEEKRDKYLAVIKLVESDPSSELYPYLDHIKKLEGPKYAAKVGEVAEASYAATDLFELNNFFRQHKLSTNVIPDSFFLSLGDTLAEKISGQASDIIPRLNYLLNICTENNYAKKKQFTFGDGDSHIWLPTIPNAVCFDGQNFGFMAVQGKTTEDWQVYHFSREGYTNYKTDNQVIKNLQKVDKLYDITTTIEGGKITYAHGFVEHCQFSLNYATEVLVEKTG